MNLPQNSDSTGPTDGAELEQYRQLRRLVQATAVSVLILAGTLFVFLYRQVVLVRRQTADLSRYIDEVNRSGMPDFMENVREKFNEFRRQHPDFNPIYVRYFGTNEPPVREKVTSAPSTGGVVTPVPTIPGRKTE